MQSWRTAAWGLAVIAAGYGLLHINFRVRALEDEHDRLLHAVTAEQRNIHVLKAEWSARTDPARIEALARRFLPGLGPAGAVNFVNPEDVPRRDDVPATAAAAKGRLQGIRGEEI